MDTADGAFLDQHVRTFNAGVATGDWREFVARFTDDGVLEFVGPPVGPFVGREAIAQAYAQSPPDDTVEITGAARTDGEHLVAPYRWHTTGATGTMRFERRGDLVARLVVTFD